MRKELADKRAEGIRALAVAGFSRRKTAQELGLTYATVAKYANAYSIAFNGRVDPERLAALADQGLTMQQAAGVLGVHYLTIRRVAAERDIAFIRPGMGVKDADRFDAIVGMFNAGKNMAQIGKAFGVSRERVRQILSKYAAMTAKDGGASLIAAIKRRKAEQAAVQKSIARHGCAPDVYRQFQAEAAKARESRNPAKAPLNAFNQQKANAARRGVAWNLKFFDWWTIWDRSGHWEDRGRGQGYMMCRFGDTGPYEIGNVYVATGVHNALHQPNNPNRSTHPDFEKTWADRRAARASQEAA